MLEKFKEHITTNFPEILSSNIAVACSGGKDSVVLVHLLQACKLKFDLIHCNFNLRGVESDQDQYFVEALASRFKCEIHITNFDTLKIAEQKGVSIQMAARDLRYNAFNFIAHSESIDHVLVAHHLDDQLETFLINLGRGAGVHGLTGIRDRNGIIVRPLLDFSSADIEDYAIKNKIKWREDSSNSSTKYLRNKLRHEVIPLLKLALPHLEKNFAKTISHLKNTEGILDVEIARFRESGTIRSTDSLIINIEKLQATIHPETYLYELLKDYSFHIPDAVDLLHAENGKYMIAGSMQLIKNNTVLELRQIEPIQTVDKQIELKNNDVNLPEGLLNIKIISPEKPLEYLKSILPDTNKLLMDAGQISESLQLRTWQHGDRMSPYGMKGSKLISDILTDAKISSLKREKALVLKSGSDIVWLLGIRTSRHHTITEKTKSILEITIEL